MGGFFSRITDRLQQNHAHQGLAKLNAKDGSVNESWKADLKTSIPMAKSSGFSFAFKGDTVYVGGQFEKVNDQDRKNLVALKMNNGSVQNEWIADANEAVHALLIQGETVYVGGNFTEIGKDKTNQPYPRNHLAALDIDGTVKEDWIVNANQWIESLAIQENSLYIAGEFTTLSDKNGNSYPRGHLAALNAAEGTIQEGWKVSTENRVTDLLIQGNLLYLAGDFRSIAIGNESTVRNFLAALTLDGKVTRWNPDANNSVYAVAGGNKIVLAGGLFDSFFDPGSYYYISSSHLAQFQSNQTIQFKESTLRVNENAGFINLEILLSEPNTVPVQVNYKVTGGNAKSEDYQLKDGVATISDGQTQANISFQVIDNNKVDGDRMVEIALFNPLQASLGANQKLTLTIVDNEQSVPPDEDPKKNGTGNGGGCSVQESTASSHEIIIIVSLFFPLLLLRLKKYKKTVS